MYCNFKKCMGEHHFIKTHLPNVKLLKIFPFQAVFLGLSSYIWVTFLWKDSVKRDYVKTVMHLLLCRIVTIISHSPMTFQFKCFSQKPEPSPKCEM